MICIDVFVKNYYVATVECMYDTYAKNIMHALSEVYDCTFKVELIDKTRKDAYIRYSEESDDE